MIVVVEVLVVEMLVLVVEVLDSDVLVVWLCRCRSRRELIFGLCLCVRSKGGSFPKLEPGSRTEEGQQHVG